MYKKLLSAAALLVCFFLIHSSSYSGSLEALLGETNLNGSPDDFSIALHANVKNVSASTKPVRLRVETTSLKEGHQVLFCFGVSCYPPFTSDFEMPQGEVENIKSGDSSEYGLKLELVPNGIIGKSTIKIIFLIDGNPADRAEFNASFNVGATGVVDDIQITRIYPNPASDFFKFETAEKLASNAVLNLFDMKGNLVKSVSLVNGIETINTKDLPEGYYPVSIISSNKTTNSAIIIKR